MTPEEYDDPRGYFHIRRSEGLGPRIKFGGKIWGKVRPSSPNKRKNLGSSVTTRRKSWEKNPNFGIISEIQRAQFGVFVTYIFGGKIWGICHSYFWRKNFQQEFQRQISGSSPPPPPPPIS